MKATPTSEIENEAYIRSDDDVPDWEQSVDPSLRLRLQSTLPTTPKGRRYGDQQYIYCWDTAQPHVVYITGGLLNRLWTQDRITETLATPSGLLTLADATCFAARLRRKAPTDEAVCLAHEILSAFLREELQAMQDIFARCEVWMAQGPGPLPGQFAADLKLREYYYRILVYLNGKRNAIATVTHNGVDRVVPQGEKDRGYMWFVARDVKGAYIKVLFHIPAKKLSVLLILDATSVFSLRSAGVVFEGAAVDSFAWTEQWRTSRESVDSI